jgi:hypothetical protein
MDVEQTIVNWVLLDSQTQQQFIVGRKQYHFDVAWAMSE